MSLTEDYIFNEFIKLDKFLYNNEHFNYNSISRTKFVIRDTDYNKLLTVTFDNDAKSPRCMNVTGEILTEDIKNVTADDIIHILKDFTKI